MSSKFFFGLFLFISVCAWGQEAEKPCVAIRRIPESELAFQDGEKFRMIGSYKWGVVNTDVGYVDLQLHRENHHPEPQFFAQADIRTARFFNTFFKMEDHYESRFNVSDNLPTYFMRDIHENKYTIQNHYKYNADHTISARIIRRGNVIQDTLLPGRICTFDFVTLVYFLRNMELDKMRVGDVTPISFAVDDDIFDLTLRYDGIENIKVQGLGTFRCKKFAATTVAGVVFDGKEQLFFWVTDDKNRLPIYVESPLVIGRVTGRLASYEHLKYPLTSLIKK